MDKFLSLPMPWHSQSISHPPNSSTLTPQSSIHSITSLDSAGVDGTAQFRCLATLQGHSSYVFSLAVSGKDLYSGAADGEIRVWIRNPNSISFNYDYGYTVGEGYSAVKSIAVAGDKVITAHQDHKIRVWRVDYGKYRMIATLPTVNDRCLRIFSAKNYVQIRRHNKRTWVHHVDAVSCVAVTGDGEFLYSVSWDRTMKVWRTSDFRCVESVQNAHDDAINAVVLSSSAAGGYSAFTCSADKKIKLWRKREGEKTHSLKSTMEKHKSAVNALALAGDGGVLYSGACDRSIILWESEGGGNWTAAMALKGHKKAVLCLAVVGELLCSGSADRTVRIWRRKSGCLAVLEGHTSPVKCLTAVDLGGMGMDGGDFRGSLVVYSGGLDFEIRVWQIEI